MAAIKKGEWELLSLRNRNRISAQKMQISWFLVDIVSNMCSVANDSPSSRGKLPLNKTQISADHFQLPLDPQAFGPNGVFINLLPYTPPPSVLNSLPPPPSYLPPTKYGGQEGQRSGVDSTRINACRVVRSQARLYRQVYRHREHGLNAAPSAYTS